MKEFKSIIIAAVAGVSAILCVLLGARGLVEVKQEGKSSGISATGSASIDFDSDLGVWRGGFSAHGETSKIAYGQIQANTELVKRYFEENGVTEEEMSFFSVDIAPKINYIYNSDGNVVGEVQDGYDLTQTFTVSSSDVDKIDRIANECTKLIDDGVEIFSDYPEYYYTKLEELKLQLIEAATRNAKSRIDIVAGNSGSSTEKLLSANLGVFQITGANSATEEYSSGGTFNTSSRIKTASITVRLNYSAK